MVNSLIYSGILYYLVGFNSAPAAFFFYLLCMVLTTMIGLFIAQFIAALSPSIETATSLFPVSVFFSISFAGSMISLLFSSLLSQRSIDLFNVVLTSPGYIVFIPQFPNWLGNWAPYISFMRYSFQAFVLNELQGNDEKLPYGQSYIDSLGFEDLSKWQCIPILIAFLLFNAVLVLLALRFFNFEKR